MIYSQIVLEVVVQCEDADGFLKCKQTGSQLTKCPSHYYDQCVVSDLNDYKLKI